MIIECDESLAKLFEAYDFSAPDLMMLALDFELLGVAFAETTGEGRAARRIDPDRVAFDRASATYYRTEPDPEPPPWLVAHTIGNEVKP